MPLYSSPSKNAVQKTLGAQLLSGSTTSATLSDTTGIPNLPGVMVIDRVDSNGVETPNKREYIAYTGTSGSTVTGLTRNVDSGSTNQDHAVGAIVEFIPDVTWAGSIYTALSNLVGTTSLTPDTTKIFASASTISSVVISNSIIASGASLQGITPITPTWFIPGFSSGATTSVGCPVDMPQSGNIEFVSAILRTAISGASLVLDVKKNGTSIFGATTTRISILGVGPDGVGVGVTGVGERIVTGKQIGRAHV